MLAPEEHLVFDLLYTSTEGDSEKHHVIRSGVQPHRSALSQNIAANYSVGEPQEIGTLGCRRQELLRPGFDRYAGNGEFGSLPSQHLASRIDITHFRKRQYEALVFFKFLYAGFNESGFKQVIMGHPFEISRP